MPLSVSSSAGSTSYGSTSMSGSSGSTLSGAAWPVMSSTGSYPSPTTGAMMMVSGSDCYDLYVYVESPSPARWVLVTGSC